MAAPRATLRLAASAEPALRQDNGPSPAPVLPPPILPAGAAGSFILTMARWLAKHEAARQAEPANDHQPADSDPGPKTAP